jgi:hypothetical protein
LGNVPPRGSVDKRPGRKGKIWNSETQEKNFPRPKHSFAGAAEKGFEIQIPDFLSSRFLQASAFLVCSIK